jgi:sugar phosphate isomerase/epimerase
MKDEHLWPGEGTIDWPTVLPILSALPEATPAILEPVCDRVESTESVTRRASRVFSEHARLVGQLRLI